jgi:hypothetical protein
VNPKHLDVGFLIFYGLFVLIGLFAFAANYIKESCGDDLVAITQIGGCNESGCGVKYSDGSFGTEVQPVIGKLVSVCK